MSATVLLQVYFLVQNRKAGVDDAEVQFDERVAMRCNDTLDGVEVLYLLSMPWRVDVGKLMEKFCWCNFSKGPVLGGTLSFVMIIEAKIEKCYVVLIGCSNVLRMSVILKSTAISKDEILLYGRGSPQRFLQ